MPNAMVPLSNITLGSTQASVTFSSIPTGATYRDLFLVAQYKNTNAGIQAMIRVNSDASTIYNNVGVAGYSTSIGTWANALTGRIQAMNFTGALNTEFTLLQMNFMDYAQVDREKVILLRSNHSGEIDAMISKYPSTAAINSITLLPETGTFAAGSTFALYGIVS